MQRVLFSHGAAALKLLFLALLQSAKKWTMPIDSRRDVAMISIRCTRKYMRDRKDWFSIVWDHLRLLRAFARPVLLLFVVDLSVCAQEFIPEQVVFPITDFKPEITYFPHLSITFGTGFCLDQNCRFVGTNYHVARLMGKNVRIKGVRSAHLYLDSGPDDSGAQDLKLVGGGSLKFTPAHDLAIYQMRQPLKNCHGVGFDAGDLEYGAKVDIYAHPLNLNPKRRLIRWSGRFIGKTRQGLLAVSYDEGHVQWGASGGIVVDSKTKQIVGILSSISEGTDRTLFAVPIKELSNFVARTQPYLQKTLFPKTVFISPVAPDLYPAFIWRGGSFSQRLADAPEVVKLRRTTQHLADSMRNFTATQMFSWGHDSHEPDVTEAYDTLIFDGWQRWRRPSDGKWFYDQRFIPRFWLRPSVGTGDLWIRLPRILGTELNLPIHKASDATVGGRNIHVFQYAANAEDEVCRIWWIGWSWGSKIKSYDCHGEVWMDDSGTILRISESFNLSGPLYHLWGVMTYGWLEKDGAKYLVPMTFATQSEGRDAKTYWCRSLFTDYDMFKAKAHIVFPAEADNVETSKPGVH